MDSCSPDARQNLLERLLNSVKQVQVYFGAKQEIATESDARVSALCVEWEMVLTHAARKPKPKNSLRLTGRTEGVSLWPLAKLCVSQEDLQRFHRLLHVKSELGRGRAWLRAAINERTLENYMHTIVSQEEELRKLYEPDAFLLDQERSSMLPVMAAGLSSIIFSISADASYLNTPSRSVEVPAPAPPAFSVPHVEVPPIQQPVVLEQKIPVSSDPYPSNPFPSDPFPSDPSPSNPFHAAGSQPYLHANEPDEDTIAISAKVKKKRQKKSKSRSPHLIERLAGSESISNSVTLPSSLLEVDMPAPLLKESASSSSSRLSLDSVNDDAQTPLYVALPMSTDIVSGEARAAASATALVLSASLPTEPSTSEESPLQQDAPHNQNQDADMRTALLSLSKMKDDLEAQNRELGQSVAELKAELEKMCEEREYHSTQKLALERENDLLREQLKKYITILQSKHQESPSTDMLSSSSSDLKHTTSTTGSATTDNPLTQADKKLQEMAEMYGDLIELNDRLHRNLADKDGTICSLVHLLRETGIEVPLAHQLPAAAAAAAAADVETKIRLVEVWIPSVIKKGRGPEGFHVYQVFVSVRGVEWNVYRRYTEFRDFHRQLQKHLPEVASFNFPPKKAIGNKSTQVVEERRQRLQKYLRLVIKLCGAKGISGGTQSIINRSISKETLVTMFPFFKEDFNQDPLPAPQPPSYSGL